MTIRAVCAIMRIRSSGRSRRCSAGREFGAAHPGYVEDSVAAGKRDELCLFSYTSGTTSRPKGVMLTHFNLLGPAEGFVQAEGLRASDEHLSYLPMAWIGKLACSRWRCIWGSAYDQLSGKPETLRATTDPQMQRQREQRVADPRHRQVREMLVAGAQALGLDEPLAGPRG